MRATKKRTDEMIAKIIGEDAVHVAKLIGNRKNVSEFEISTKIKQDIQVTRNILYRLHDKNLVVYKRVKDRKKGWYVSYWTIDKSRVKELIDQMKDTELEKYQQRLKAEQEYINNYYICRNICVRMNFDDAAEFSFKCPECGQVLDHQNNERTIEVLKEKIKELKA
jgi:transcription initiation factor TFIIE subunit alpha